MKQKRLIVLGFMLVTAVCLLAVIFSPRISAQDGIVAQAGGVSDQSVLSNKTIDGSRLTSIEPVIARHDPKVVKAIPALPAGRSEHRLLRRFASRNDGLLPAAHSF